jgi:tRNA A37 threonylcarbamoyladenosine dehydratase
MISEYWQVRTELLIGKDKINKLKESHVLVVGLGGVGAYAAENLCRAGVGELTIVDGDVFNHSNKNRQLPALESTIGKPKAEVLGNRLLDINPDLKLNIIQEYLREERIIEVLSIPYDYVVDAIDTLSPKVFLIQNSLKNGLKIVSSLGAGARLDPTKITIKDISKSYNCRLGVVLRKRLRKIGISKGFQVVFSEDKWDENAVIADEQDENKKSMVGTISYMPPIYGCFCASVVIRDLIK